MDLDLNQEPWESPTSPILGLTPLLNELDTVHEHIEERIRQLEAVTSRIRERQTLRQGQRQTTPQIVSTFSAAGTVNTYHQEIFHESGRVGKIDGAELIAKALGMEKKSPPNAGGYFDCNICLERASDPILTCCGHLFCWPCFYQLPYCYSNVKECPVCEGEVSETSVVPIYGNGNNCDDITKPNSKESGVHVPPRPHAKRVESVRQKLITNGIPVLPMDETIQHMRRLIDAIGRRTRSQGSDTVATNSSTGANQPNQYLGFENLDGPIVGTNMRRGRQESFHGVAGNSVSSFDDVVRWGIQSLGTAEIISLVPVPSGSTIGFGVPNVVADTGTEMGSTPPSTSSSRRRMGAADVDGRARNRSRRRLR